MKKFTLWVARKLIVDSDQVEDSKIREKYGLLEGWVSIVGNTLLFVFKLVIGLTVNSISLIADAVHSLSDTATSIVVIAGFKISNKPPDPEHPYGHGRAEYIATLIISILLVVTGVEFIRSSFERITHPEKITATIGLLLAVFATIVIKELMGQFSKYLGLAIESDTLEADFWHHRTDAISSGLVLIALIAGNFGIPSLDGYAGLGVAGILIYTGFDIARGAVDTLLGRPPKPSLVQKIRKKARDIPKVIDAHDIVVHNYGNHSFINLHIEVDEKEDVMVMHDAAEAVEELFRREMNAYATVHIDPISIDSTEVKQVRDAMNKIVKLEERVQGFHDLRIVHTEEYHRALMDIMLKQDTPDSEIESVTEKVKRQLNEEFPDIEFHIQVTPLHKFK